MKKRIVEIGIVVGVIIMMWTSFKLEDRTDDDFMLQAHRGWSEYYPENTLASFEAAAKCEQYDAIETDVQETADGFLVLMHDGKLDRTTNAEGKMGDYTLQEVEAFAIDGGNNVDTYSQERIPLLEEYLDICKTYQKIPYIEMKKLSDEGIEKLLRTLDEGGWKDKCVLTSFSYTNIKRVRDITDNYKLEYMIKKNADIEEAIDKLLDFKNIGLRPYAYDITAKDVKACMSNGMFMECWGINVGDKEEYVKLTNIGVQGGTCNDWQGL